MADNSPLKQITPHLISVAILFLTTLMYFYPQLQGKKIPSGDIVSAKGMAQEIDKYHEKTGKQSWWTNSMFGGMPAYQVTSRQPQNKVVWLNNVFSLFFSRPIGMYFAAMMAFYIGMLAMGINRWLALIGALGFGLTTNSMFLYEAGHVAKLRTIFYFPMLLAGVFLTYRQKYIVGAGLFAVGMALSNFGNHPQMLYYLALTLIAYIIAEIVRVVRSGEFVEFAKASAFLLLALIISVGSSSSKLWTTYEYSKDTMRGDPILKSANNQVTSSSETKGLEWTYAMRWSNGFIDLFTTFIPGLVGGSSGETLGKISSGCGLYQRFD